MLRRKRNQITERVILQGRIIREEIVLAAVNVDRITSTRRNDMIFASVKRHRIGSTSREIKRFQSLNTI